MLVNPQELLKIVKELYVLKATVPEGVAGWILREFTEQLVGLRYEIIKSSQDDRKVPMDWKRVNILPIYKGGGDKEDPLNYR